MSTIKRQILFKSFAKNFEFVRPYLEQEHGLNYKNDLIACPICLTLYTEQALNQEIENPLTIEHIPPDSLGGKGLILVCKKCNNAAGVKLDKTLLEHTKVKDFYAHKPESNIDTNISLNGKPLVKAKITFKGNNTFFIKSVQSNDDNRILDFKDLVKTGNIEMRLKTVSERHSLIAALRIGYLFIFSRIGHPYIYNSRHDQIRRQIMNPDLDILPELIVSRNIEEGTKDAVSILKEPSELRSLSVGFYTDYQGLKHYTRINLPLPSQDAYEFYNKMKNFQGTAHKVEVAHLSEEADFLTNRELAASLWQDLEYFGHRQEEN